MAKILATSELEAKESGIFFAFFDFHGFAYAYFLKTGEVPRHGP